MLAEQFGCNHFDISTRISQEKEIDFDSLVPDVEVPESDRERLAEYQSKQKETQGMDVLSLDLFNAMLHHCLFNKDFRSAFWLTVQANTGLRYSDAVKFRRADFIDEHNKIRDCILVQEKKTDKQRVIYINKAIKETLLMLIWNNDISPMDYLITSQGTRKGYETETYINSKGREVAVRDKNGNIVYKLDANGNKIPKPLTRTQSERLMKSIIIESLGVNLKNDWRSVDKADASDKINTHSIRKLYGWSITQGFISQFDSDEAYAHAAALSFLSQDYGHSSEAMTTRYSKDFDALKKEIVLNMNLGLNVIHSFFEEEMNNYLSKRQK